MAVYGQTNDKLNYGLNNLQLLGTKPCQLETEDLELWYLEGVDQERLQLNEESVFKKDGQVKDVKGGYKHVDKVRSLLFEKKYEDAEKLMKEKLMGKRLDGGNKYLPNLGRLNITFSGVEEYSGYYRELDLNNATVILSLGWIVFGITERCFHQS